MNRNRRKEVVRRVARAAAVTLVTTGCVSSWPTYAQDESSSSDFFGMGMNFSGFVRLDAAYNVGDPSPYNQLGNPFNRRPIQRSGGYPLNGGVLGTVGTAVGDILSGITLPTGTTLNEVGLINDTVVRDFPRANDDWNVSEVRARFDLGISISDHLSMYVSARTVYEIDTFNDFNGQSDAPYPDEAVGFNPDRPSYFEYDKFGSGGCQNRLEICGRRYMIDLPSAYIDYQNGPVLVRVGSQQIAWGQALFYRVFDVPNGLDLRRHFFLDFGAEEYADERISSPAVRVTAQLTNEWEVDAFAQLFQPTILPNLNTPYNLVASGFSIHDSYRSVDDDVNYGIRLRGSMGQWGAQFIAARRRDPNGVFKWRVSDVSRGVPGPAGTELLADIFAQTPFEVASSGVYSAPEWFFYAGSSRLDGVEAINVLVDEFPAVALLAQPVTNEAEAESELDLFFQLAGGTLAGRTSGGLRGHLAREYPWENVFGAGVSYVVEAEPGSLFDQLIANVELTYTPDRSFTHPGLSRHYIEKDEYVGALVLEKYQRFSQDFPATYLVFQALHKTESDLFGRNLGCQGGTDSVILGSKNERCHDIGKYGFTSLVFAFQQPFPNLVWRLDGAVLFDVRGGVLVQPAVRWKPTGDWTVDMFYNYTNGQLYGHEEENIIQTIDFIDELSIRIGYQF